MFKKIAIAAAAAAIAATGVTVGAPSANAASHPAGSTYLHGTSRMTSFTARSTCERYAAGEVRTVQRASSRVRLLGAQYNAGVRGPELRLSCYPVLGGRWTYLTAYVSKSGAPLNAADRFVDLLNRLDQMDNNRTLADSENLWVYVHAISSPSTSVSRATCDQRVTAVTNAVLRGRGSRLVTAYTQCTVSGGQTSYFVAYAGSNTRAGVYKDRGEAIAAVPMLDALGYNYPLPDEELSMARAHVQRQLR